MIITAINKDKKHLTKISLSSGEELLLDSDLCAEKALKCGMELESEEL